MFLFATCSFILARRLFNCKMNKHFYLFLHFQTKNSQSNWRRRLMNGNYVCMTLGRCRKTIVDAISNSTCPEKMRHLRFLFISVQISTSRRLNERQISLNKESANRSMWHIVLCIITYRKKLKVQNKTTMNFKLLPDEILLDLFDILNDELEYFGNLIIFHRQSRL